MKPLMLCLWLAGSIPVYVRAQIPIHNLDAAVTEDFNAFDGSGFAPNPADGQLDADDFIVRGLGDGDLDFGGTGELGDFARGISSGGVGTGGVYAFETATGDFGLGVQPTGSDFTPGIFVVRYQNNTGATIGDMNIAYEIKVLNDQSRSNAFNLSYAASSTCPTNPEPGNLTFTDISAADFTSDEAADAFPVWESVSREIYIDGLSIADNDCLYLRFTGDDVGGSGSRDEFALDDLSITANPTTPLPVELVAFDAVLDGRAVRLVWETASETNNAGFSVMRRAECGVQNECEEPWKEIGWVDGHGTTEQPQQYAYRVAELPPGVHRFRLKQVDYDGTFAYSPEVEVAVAMPEAYHLSSVYPNPVRTQTRFSLSVARSQYVEVAVYDLLGRHMARPYAGSMVAGTTRSFTVDASGLSAGVYVLRITGDYFTASRQVVRIPSSL